MILKQDTNRKFIFNFLLYPLCLVATHTRPERDVSLYNFYFSQNYLTTVSLMIAWTYHFSGTISFKITNISWWAVEWGEKELILQDLHVHLISFQAWSESCLAATWRLAGVQSIYYCQPWISALRVFLLFSSSLPTVILVLDCLWIVCSTLFVTFLSHGRGFMHCEYLEEARQAA